MSLGSFKVALLEPESNWHLCSYRGWLIAVLPIEEGFVFEYLAPDGESHRSATHCYASMSDAIQQAKASIKRQATLWLMDGWLCELQEQETIDMREYCQLFKSLRQAVAQ